MSERTIKGVAAAAMTFGLGTLLALPLLFVVHAVVNDIETAELVSIAAGIAYPVAAGYLFYQEDRAPEAVTAPSRRRREPPVAEPAAEPVDVRVIDEVLDHDNMLAGLRAVRARSAEHRLRAMRGEETDAFATGYAAALRDLAAGVVQASRAAETKATSEKTT